MRIGIFTDAHYSSQEVTCKRRYNSRSLKKIGEAYDTFKAAGCDLVISLGDLIDKEHDHGKEVENLRAVREQIDSFGLPTFAVRGNHDAFCFTEEEFYEILGESYRPRAVFAEGKVLFFLDACFYASGESYAPGEGDWKDTYFPDSEAFAERLAEGEGDAYVFLHQNVDPNVREDHRIANDALLRALLEQSGRVRAVYQGHYHPGCRSVHNGISYVTFPAMCENDCAFEILEI